MQYKTKTVPMGVGVAMGLAVSWAITLLLALVVAIFVSAQRIGEGAVAPLAVATIILATLGGAVLAAGKIGSRRMIVCLLSGGVYFVSLLGCNVLFFGGEMHGVVAAMLLIFGLSVLAGLMGLRKKEGKYGRFAKRF